MFYRVINKLGDQLTPPDVGDFRLMSRRAVDALLQLREHHRFMKGLFVWIGFRQPSLSTSEPLALLGEPVELLAPLEFFDRRHHKLLYSPPSVCFLFWSFDCELGCAIWVIHRRADDCLQ
jgi:hypothetical protein